MAYRNIFKNDLVAIGANIAGVMAFGAVLGYRVEKKLDRNLEEQEARLDEIEGTIRGHVGLIEDSLDRIEGKPNAGKQGELYGKRSKDEKEENKET